MQQNSEALNPWRMFQVYGKLLWAIMWDIFFMILQLGNFRRSNNTHTWFPQPAEFWPTCFASAVLGLPPSLPRWEEAVYPHWVWMMVASVLETSHKTDGMPSSCPRSPLATRRPMLHGAHHGLLLCWFSKAPEANGICTGSSLLPAEAHPKAPLFLEPIPCSTSMEDSKEWKDSKAKASKDRQTKERKGYLRNSLEEKRSGKQM